MSLIILNILIILFSFLAGVAYTPMHSILSMLLTYLCTGFLFIYLGLEFMGLIYIIVYSGAIVILFIFILMLTNQPYKDKRSPFNNFYFHFCLLILFFSIIIANKFFNGDALILKRTDYSDFLYESDLEIVSRYLYDVNFVHVLAIAILLFIALVSVVITTIAYRNMYVKRRVLLNVHKINKNSTFVEGQNDIIKK